MTDTSTPAPADPAPNQPKAVTIPLWETRLVAALVPAGVFLGQQYGFKLDSAAAEAALDIVALIIGAAIYGAHGLLAAIHAHKITWGNIGQYAAKALDYVKGVANQLHPLTATASPLIAQLEKVPAVASLESRLSALEQNIAASVPAGTVTGVLDALAGQKVVTTDGVIEVPAKSVPSTSTTTEAPTEADSATAQAPSDAASAPQGTASSAPATSVAQPPQATSETPLPAPGAPITR